MLTFRLTGRHCAAILAGSLVVALLIWTAVSTDAASNPDLAAAYSFDQGSGSILSDDSGNGKTGTITNGLWSAGKYGQAMSLAGNGFANIGDFSLVTAPFTIEFWFSMSALPTGGFYKLFGQGGCCALAPAILLGDQLLIQTGPDQFAYGSTTFTGTSLNQWYHAAFVVDSLSSIANWKVYVNGNNVTGRMGAHTGPSTAFGNATSIGGNDLYTGFKNFKGLIDELRIYRTARSQAQIQADMVTPIAQSATSPSTPTPTLAFAASPASIDAGASTTLTWSSTNATACTASGTWSGSVATSGSLSVSPATTSTYTLSCSGSAQSVSRSVTATVTDAAPPPPTGSGSFQSSVFASGINAPTAMEFAPDGRLFVLEKGGSVRVIKNGVLLSTPFVTVPALSDNEHGLIGIAFDPDFNSNRYVYLYYTRPTSPPTNGVSRFTANGDTAVSGSELSILDQDYSGGPAHNGGAIHFGLDGKLYVAVGAYNPNDSQNLGRYMGKILRINADGTVPPDNPFVTTPGARPEIWAYGFRNPYTFAVDSATGVIYVNDVGEANWEEVNLLTKGGNFGWPVCEGPRNSGIGSCSSSSLSYPVYAYPHNGSSMSITGGVFYRATQFPSTYRGSYFFGDYAAGFIKGLNSNNALFDFSNLSSPDAASGTVDLKVGPDGALYYASIYTNTVFRISYFGAASNTEPVATLSASPTTGMSPLTVTFNGSGTDADGDALSYSWNFGDGVTDVGATVTHTYYAIGQYTATLTVDDGHGGSDLKTKLIVVGNPPTPQIVTPSAGFTYQGGDTIAYSGVATDVKDGDLPGSAFSWTIVFHHDTHTHPFLGPIVGTKAGSFLIPSSGEVSANTWYRIHLVVTDSDGLKSEVTRDVVPVTSSFTVNTNVPGLIVTLDGQPFPTPFTTSGVVNFARAISAPSPQTVNGDTYVFSSWSDGGAATHTIRIPSTSTTYVATYVLTTAPPVDPPPAPPNANDPDLAAAYSFDQGSGSVLIDDSGNGKSGTITNGAWSAGRFGQALSLDGTGFANIGDFSSVTVPYTIEFWFSMSAVPTGGFYKLFGQGGCCALMPAILLSNQFTIQTGPDRFVYGSTTFTAASLNQWRHAAFVVDSLTSMANWKVYVDGIDVTGRMGNHTGASTAFGNATSIGGNDQYSGFKNFKGLIDELRIYRTARSQTQIQADMVTPIK